jgi:probable HAF family extracellular repeat protein
MKLLRIAGLVIGLALACQAKAEATVQYTVTDLGTWGGKQCNPFDVNVNGEVVGRANASMTSNTTTPFYWKNGQMYSLPPINGSGFAGYYTISDQGIVAGESSSTYTINGVAVLHPTSWNVTNQVATDMSTIPSVPGKVVDISDNGYYLGWQQTGTTGTPFYDQRVYVWYKGVCTLISQLGYPNTHVPTTIDAQGGIFGKDMNGVGFYYRDGALYSLGTLGGSQSVPYKSNALGQAAGYSYTAGDAEQKAFLWTPFTPNTGVGTLKDLGTLGGANSQANDIDAWGNVVGHADLVSGTKHAFLYTRCGTMVDLNSLIDPNSGWELVSAEAISNAGHIVGTGKNGTMGGRGFLLTPI